MNSDHVKAAAEKAKGVVKEAAGKVTDNKRLEAEGKLDQAKGEARKVVADVKDAAKKAS